MNDAERQARIDAFGARLAGLSFARPGAAAARLRRREKIETLAESGATEGEREAARAALHRLEHPSTQAHDATEQGRYYARDTLAHGGDDG